MFLARGSSVHLLPLLRYSLRLDSRRDGRHPSVCDVRFPIVTVCIMGHIVASSFVLKTEIPA
jgi:hypothetical protein